MLTARRVIKKKNSLYGIRKKEMTGGAKSGASGVIKTSLYVIRERQ